jgi:hypothetical protein
VRSSGYEPRRAPARSEREPRATANWWEPAGSGIARQDDRRPAGPRRGDRDPGFGGSGSHSGPRRDGGYQGTGARGTGGYQGTGARGTGGDRRESPGSGGEGRGRPSAAAFDSGSRHGRSERPAGNRASYSDGRPSSTSGRPSSTSGRPSSTGRPASAGGAERRYPRSDGDGRGRNHRVEEDYESTRGSRPTRGAEIAIPAGADPKLLDPSVRAELRSLSKLAAEFVGAHLVAAGQAIDTDPKKALEHARAARGRGARVAAVREATGLAAYHAGEWAEALSELRAARRISGDASNIAVMADCERALGRPERALKALDDPAVPKLDPATRAELIIVVAGARRDLNQLDAALAVFERGGLDAKNPKPGSARLWYAYADALAEAGRIEEAIQWFGAAAKADFDDETDAADRAADLL